MERAEVFKYINELFECYQTIPVDAFTNSITGKSAIYPGHSEFIKKGYMDNLNTPAGMFLQRKEVGDVSVTFQPVFFYDTETTGIKVSYYNVKKQSSFNIGPFRTADDMTDKIMEYIDSSTITFVIDSLKADLAFMSDYPTAHKKFEMKIESLPELPLMQMNDSDSFLGPQIMICAEYVNNPYTYNDVMMKVYKLDGWSGFARVNYVEPILPGQLKFYEKFSKKDSAKVIKDAIKSIKESRKEEDELIKEIKEFANEYNK